MLYAVKIKQLPFDYQQKKLNVIMKVSDIDGID